MLMVPPLHIVPTDTGTIRGITSGKACAFIRTSRPTSVVVTHRGAAPYNDPIIPIVRASKFVGAEIQAEELETPLERRFSESMDSRYGSHRIVNSSGDCF